MDEFQTLDNDMLIRIVQEEQSKSRDENNLRTHQRQESTLAYSNVDIMTTKLKSGLSQLNVNKISPVVNTMSTYMVKQHLSDDESIVYEPMNDSAEATLMAQQTTSVVNYFLFNEGDGFNVISDAIKDALINKNCHTQISPETNMVTTRKLFANRFPEQINIDIQQEEAMGNSVKVLEDEVVYNEDGSMDVPVECSYETFKVKFDNVPPEEFQINEEAKDINSTDSRTFYVGRNQIMSVGEIIKLYPKYKNKTELLTAENETASGFGTDYTEKQERGVFDGSDYQDAPDRVGSRREVTITESFIKVDGKVKGIKGNVEWVRLVSCAKEVLELDRWDGEIPYVGFTFFRLPFKYWGLSIYDKIRDYNKAATSLLRSELDVRVLQNTPRFIGPKDAVDTRAFMKVKPGFIGLQRGALPNSIIPVPAPAGSPNTIQLGMEIDKLIEAEIGINPITGMISSEIEKSGNDMDKTQAAISNSSAKIEWYSRRFGEEYLRPLHWQVLNILIENADHPYVRKIVAMLEPKSKGQLLAALPQFRDFVKRSNIKSKVGLGHLTSTDKQRGIAQVMAAQQMLMAPVPEGGMMVPDKYRIEAAKDMVKHTGLSPAKFIPTEAEIQEANQMKMQQAQAQIQQQQQMAQMFQQLEMQSKQADIAHKQSQAEENKVDAFIKAEKVDIDKARLQLDREKAQAEVALESQQKRPVAI